MGHWTVGPSWKKQVIGEVPSRGVPVSGPFVSVSWVPGGELHCSVILSLCGERSVPGW